MQNCSGAAWQEWAPVPTSYYIPGAPGILFTNEYDLKLMATNSLTSGTYVYSTGNFADQGSEWYF